MSETAKITVEKVKEMACQPQIVIEKPKNLNEAKSEDTGIKEEIRAFIKERSSVLEEERKQFLFKEFEKAR
jgi:hypothetical protein